MKVSQEQAKEKIAEFTEENILGTALLFLLIIHVVEPVTRWITEHALKAIKNRLARLFKFKLPTKK